MRKLLVFAVLFLLLGSLSVAVFAQEGSPLPEPTSTPVVEPTVEPFPFPEAPPELPKELPTDPSELLGLLDYLIFWGLGLAAKYLVDLTKLVPWLNKRQGENVRRQVLKVMAVVASLVVAIVAPYASEMAAFLNQSGIWAVLLAMISAQWSSHRLDKLLRGVSGRLLSGLYKNPGPLLNTRGS